MANLETQKRIICLLGLDLPTLDGDTSWAATFASASVAVTEAPRLQPVFRILLRPGRLTDVVDG
jgi:hypothetical protein